MDYLGKDSGKDERMHGNSVKCRVKILYNRTAFKTPKILCLYTVPIHNTWKTLNMRVCVCTCVCVCVSLSAEMDVEEKRRCYERDNTVKNSQTECVASTINSL